MRLLLTIFAGLALAGCGLTDFAPPPAPVIPPPVDWTPPPAPEVPGDDLTPPPETDGSFDQVAVGMDRSEVERLVGAPTEDEPDNEWEDDSVRYDVSTPDGPMRLFVYYRAGRVTKVRWSPVFVAGGAE